MKKFLLASACLLTLTACGQGQEANKATAASASRQTSQTKTDEVKTKTFVKDLGDNHKNKIQIGYEKDEIVSMTIMGVAPIPEDMQKLDVAELKETFKPEIDQNNSQNGFTNVAGLHPDIQIADDKKTYTNIMHIDFSQIQKEEFAKIIEKHGGEQNSQMLKYIKGKPQDLFTYFKDNGLTEEK